jgi:hypothetical protein
MTAIAITEQMTRTPLPRPPGAAPTHDQITAVAVP